MSTPTSTETKRAETSLTTAATNHTVRRAALTITGTVTVKLY